MLQIITHHSFSQVRWLQIKIVLENGDLYVTGSFKNNQYKRPSLLKELSHVKIYDIFLGITHAIAVDFNGNMYTWGSHEYGELGVGYEYSEIESPKLNEIMVKEKVDRIFGNNHNHYMISYNGEVFVWGKNNSYQLGLKHQRHTYFPLRLSFLKYVGDFKRNVSTIKDQLEKKSFIDLHFHFILD